MTNDLTIELATAYESLGELYAEVDRNLQLVLATQAAEGIIPSCRLGCDACCHQMVMTTVAEADLAARHLATLTASEIEPINARLTAWLGATSSLRERLQGGAEGDVEVLVEALAQDYWRLQLPCPFLVERRCAIYAARPLICRHHFVASEPQLCALNGGGEVETLAAAEEAFFAAQDAVPADSQEIGLFPELISLFRHAHSDSSAG